MKTMAECGRLVAHLVTEVSPVTAQDRRNLGGMLLGVALGLLVDSGLTDEEIMTVIALCIDEARRN